MDYSGEAVIQVAWPDLANEGRIARGFWDQGIIEETLKPFDCKHGDIPESGGAVVVLAARHHIEYVAELNQRIAPLDWCILILTGDEEGLFPWREVKHRNLKVWVQTPYRDRHQDADHLFGDGAPPDCVPTLARIGPQAREIDVFFSGQVRDNLRRQECIEVLRTMNPERVVAIETEGFGEGLGYEQYLKLMARSKIVPCPSGFFTPDSFRVFEALEAGCIPVVEKRSHFHAANGYWEFTYPGAPFLSVESWYELPALVDEVLPKYDELGRACFEWWQAKKREMSDWLREDLKELQWITSPS